MGDWRTAFGMKLKAAREDVPLTQTELATLLDVAQTTVSAWERGAAVPRDGLRLRLAELVNCSIHELFAYEEVGS